MLLHFVQWGNCNAAKFGESLSPVRIASFKSSHKSNHKDLTSVQSPALPVNQQSHVRIYDSIHSARQLHP